MESEEPRDFGVDLVDVADAGLGDRELLEIDEARRRIGKDVRAERATARLGELVRSGRRRDDDRQRRVEV